MPFTNQEIQQAYNFKKFSWLALLCGPVVMLEAALRPKPIDFQDTHVKSNNNFDTKFGLAVYAKDPYIKSSKNPTHR